MCGSSSSPTCANPTTWPATCTRRWPPARSVRNGCGRCATPRAGRHRRTGRRDHHPLRSGHPGEHPRAAERHVSRRRPTLDLADGSRDRHRAVRSPSTTIAGEILVDYEGSSGASPFGINVVKNYTHAYTTFTVRAVSEPRAAQQPRQPRADQGATHRSARSSTRCRRSRARLVTWSACSCRTRC